VTLKSEGTVFNLGSSSNR